MQEEAPKSEPQVGFYAWYSLGVLIVLNVFAWLDRQVIVLLIDPIRHDLQISDVQISLLTGIAFALLYTISGLPIGWLVDRYSRRIIIFFGVIFWSLATVGCGLAKSFWGLFAGRVGVGIGEAALTPTAFSMIADIFPQRRLAIASSMFSMGAGIGQGLSLAIAGLIAAMVSHGEVVNLPLFGEVRAWQFTFILVGVPGLLLALLILTVREPKRRGSLKKAAAPQQEPAPQPIAVAAPAPTPPKEEQVDRFFQYLFRHWKFYSCHMIGFAFLSISSFGMQIWGPVYLSRAFGWSPAQIGAAFGASLSISMIAGYAVAGMVVDYFYGRGMKDAHLRLYAFAALTVIPITIAIITLNDPWLFVLGFFFFKLVIGGFGPIGIAGIQVVTPNEFRGRLIALYLFVSTMTGQGFGPFAIAALTQYVFKDDKMVGYSIMITLVCAFMLSAIFLWIGTRFMRQIQQEAALRAG